jgi:tRNA1(Val) A37 N6-methylase TrmN6
MAEIAPEHDVLEPSAGTGGLADLANNGRLTCVEVASLNAKVLAAKGHSVIQTDFLKWAAETTSRFDRIVMNPPFSEGRARAHVETAATLMAPGGRLVAIVPASHRGKITLPGCAVSWSEDIEGAFPGVSVTVAILCADKQ